MRMWREKNEEREGEETRRETEQNKERKGEKGREKKERALEKGPTLSGVASRAW